MGNCKEMIMDNLVQVDVLKQSDLVVIAGIVPVTVPSILELSMDSKQVQPIISFAFDQQSCKGRSKTPANYVGLDDKIAKFTVKSSVSKAQAGTIISYDVQIANVVSLSEDLSSAVAAEAELQAVDFSLVLHFLGGDRRLLYFLPNSSAMSVEQNISGSDTQATVKLSGKSLSNLITLK